MIDTLSPAATFVLAGLPGTRAGGGGGGEESSTDTDSGSTSNDNNSNDDRSTSVPRDSSPSDGSQLTTTQGNVLGVLIILCIIGVVVAAILFRKGGRASAAAPGPVNYPDPDSAGVARGAVQRADSLAQLDTGLGAIVAHDPAFSRDDFNAAATRIFYTVQKAWTDANPGLSRLVMADSLWHSHKVQIDQFLANGTRNRLDGLSIQVQTLVGAGVDSDSDYLIVRYFVRSADHTVDAGGKTISGTTDVKNWSEDWVYERDSTAKTNANGTLAAKCPNCSAPLDLDTSGICTYCRQPALTGADWVLTRIDQLPSFEWAEQTVPR